MARKLRDGIKIGVEAVARGTLAASLPLTQPILGEGFKPDFKPGLGVIEASSTFPYKTENVSVGVEASLSLTPDFNRDTARDLIQMATKRTSADLPAVSIQQLHEAIAGSNPQMSFLGCVARMLKLSFSRGASPDGSAILQAAMEFDCMGFTPATGLSAGSQAVAPHFQMRHSTVTINSVAAAAILGFDQTVTNALGLGPVNASNTREYLRDGGESNLINLTARFAKVDYRDLAINQTEHPVVIVFGTGTANETITATIGKAKLSSRTLADDGVELTEAITIDPQHTGAAAPVVWTFGSLIGASVLGL